MPLIYNSNANIVYCSQFVPIHPKNISTSLNPAKQCSYTIDCISNILFAFVFIWHLIRINHFYNFKCGSGYKNGVSDDTETPLSLKTPFYPSELRLSCRIQRFDIFHSRIPFYPWKSNLRHPFSPIKAKSSYFLSRWPEMITDNHSSRQLEKFSEIIWKSQEEHWRYGKCSYLCHIID